MRRLALWAPLALFLLLVGFVAVGLLRPSSATITSKMVGKPLPPFALPAALPGTAGLDRAALASGAPRLLNIFASWCVPCAAEAPILLELKRRGIRIDAIAIRDKPADVAAFLGRWGNPYERIGSDVDSRVQLALGSSGVPESFVIDGKGVIRAQHVGDIREEDIDAIQAAVEAAR